MSSARRSTCLIGVFVALICQHVLNHTYVVRYNDHQQAGAGCSQSQAILTRLSSQTQNSDSRYFCPISALAVCMSMVNIANVHGVLSVF